MTKTKISNGYEIGDKRYLISDGDMDWLMDRRRQTGDVSFGDIKSLAYDIEYID